MRSGPKLATQMVKMAAVSDEDSRSEVSEILASCDNQTSPKKKEADQNSETSSDPFEVMQSLMFCSLSNFLLFAELQPSSK